MNSSTTQIGKDNVHIGNIPLTNDKMMCIKDDKIIENGQIVEMMAVPIQDSDGYVGTSRVKIIKDVNLNILQ